MNDFETVERAFQEIFKRVWAGGTEDPGTLNALSPLDRAIYATRILEGDLDNGGWYQVLR